MTVYVVLSALLVPVLCGSLDPRMEEGYPRGLMSVCMCLLSVF